MLNEANIIKLLKRLLQVYIDQIPKFYFFPKTFHMPFFKGPYCLNPRQSFQTNDINYYSLRKFYERDSAYLGLIEAFIQDGPQLVLQLYILAVRHHDDLSDPYTGKKSYRKN